jgi:hypothetical protein
VKSAVRPSVEPVSGIASHKDDPRVIASRERIKRFGLPAAMNLQKLLSKGSRADASARPANVARSPAPSVAAGAEGRC